MMDAGFGSTPLTTGHRHDVTTTQYQSQCSAYEDLDGVIE
jgi:hypothetical protein